MRIERAYINGKSYYFVDGVRINSDALAVIIKAIFGEKVCQKVYRDAVANGFAVVERYTGEKNCQLVNQLEQANKKIAALERRVSEMTLKEIYDRG